MSNVFDGYRLRKRGVTLCSLRQDSWIFDRQSSSAQQSRREAERSVEPIAVSMTRVSNSCLTRRVRVLQRVRRLAAGRIAGTQASLDCAWVSRTEKEERDDGTCSWSDCQRHIQESVYDDRPLGKGIERFVFGPCNDSHLIAAHGVDQPSTLDDCLRAHKDEVDLVHDVGYGRVQHNCARNACSCESLIRLDPDMTM